MRTIYWQIRMIEGNDTTVENTRQVDEARLLCSFLAGKVGLAMGS